MKKSATYVMSALALGLATCGGGSSDDDGGTTTGTTGSATTDATDAGSGSSTTTTTGPSGPVCGDGVREVPEECDDGDEENGDGCDADCAAYEDSLLWSREHGGSADLPEEGTGIAVDSTGSAIVVGYVLNSQTNADIFVRKYAGDGSVTWTQTFDGPFLDDDRGCGVAVDGSDNVLVVGDQVPEAGNADIWIAKLDASGSSQWTVTVDGAENATDNAYDVAADNSGNVYVAGHIRDAVNDNDIWVGSYDSDGVERWTDTYTSDEGFDDRAFGVSVGADNSVAVAGYITKSGGANDVWVRKYMGDGTTAWTTIWDNANGGNERAFDVVVDSDGEAIVAGFSHRTATHSDIWLARFSGDAQPNLMQFYGGPAIEDDRGQGVALDPDGNIIIVGYKGIDQANNDMWIRKYDSNGSVIWTQSVFGDAGNRDEARDVAVDAGGNVFVTGGIRHVGVNSDIWVGKFGPNAS